MAIKAGSATAPRLFTPQSRALFVASDSGHYASSCYTLNNNTPKKVRHINPTEAPLCTEPIERAPRTLQGIHDVEGRHGFPLGMLSVCDGVSNNL